jgi:hypothetical protein
MSFWTLLPLSFSDRENRVQTSSVRALAWVSFSSSLNVVAKTAFGVPQADQIR